MASTRKFHREPILQGCSEGRSTRVAERLLRLLLACLVCTATGFRGENPERVSTETTPCVQGRSAFGIVTGSRAAQVALQARVSPKRRNGTGPLPGFALVPPPDAWPAASSHAVQSLRGPPRPVLPRRLNRPLYSGPPPPFRG